MKTIKNLKAEEIRKSILQLAIQGKLVKQDPNDEPASELVKRIYAEKQRLIKEGKIKKDKNESYIFKGDDNCYYEKVGNSEPVKLEDLPFDIPDNWTWIRFKTAGTIEGGFTPKNDELSNHGNVPYFKVSDMNTLGNKKYMTITSLYYLGNKKLFSPNSIIFPKNGGALFTNKKRILSQPSVVDLNTGVFTPSSCFNFDFIFTIFQSIDFRKYSKGTALPTIDKDRFECMYLAIPPLNEQKRIVEKIKSFEPLIAQYSTAEEKMSILEDEFPEKLKKSILQYAIEGKLVKQDPNDEPASALLERIKAEKEKLIKEGKIKRDKNESYIYQGDDKNYYEKVIKKNDILNLQEHTYTIPNTWSWCSLSQISKLITDGTHKTPNYVEKGVPFISIANISSGIYDGKPKFISIEEHNSLITRCKPEHNDILLCRIGTLGKPYVNKLQFDFSIFVSLALIKLVDNTLANYIKIVLDSPNTYSYIDKVKVGGGTHTFKINIEDLSTFPIPLPPKQEQIKIINRINYLFERIDNLAY